MPTHRPPATTYTGSPHPYLEPLPPLIYGGAAAVRLVDDHGVIRWHGTPIFLSSNLTGELVGLYDGLSDTLRIQYAALTLGDFELHTRRFVPAVRWTG